VLRSRDHVGGASRALPVAIATVLVALFLAPAAGAIPAKFWGVVPQNVPTTEQLEYIKKGGVSSVRIPVSWSIQSGPGAVPDWSGVDAAVGRAAEAGVDILPYMYNAPGWAVPSARVPGIHGGVAAAPRNLPATGSAALAWSAFLKLAVERYGPNGSFWSTHPRIPARPIRTWQIWNEENFKYFVTRPNPAEYGKLVKISSGAIKSVDPGAKVLLGGLFARPNEARFKTKPPQAYFASDFLEKMYQRTPGIKSKFDGVALHPYSSKFQYLTPDIEEVRAVLKANGDVGKGLWITELGWSSETPNTSDAFAKGVKGQVRQMKGAFSTLTRNQAKWHLRGVYWFSLEDGTPEACNFCGGAGLFASGFVPKPAWKAYIKFAGAAR
jgi:hypothetical protein